MRHIIFYDGECGICNLAVRHILAIDATHQFLFASLQGKTAQKHLPERLLKANTLVLMEDPDTIWIRSRAIFRIYWLAGRKSLGFLCFFPGIIGDIFYRLFALSRRQFKVQPSNPIPQEYFLE